MALTLDDLKNKLAELQRKAGQINLAASRERLAGAERKLLQVKASTPHSNPEADQQRVGAAAGEVREATFRLREAEQQDAALRREIERISGMLFAADRVVQAKASLATASGLKASASAAAQDAQNAVNTIDELIRAEQQKFELARTGAAAAMLAAVKAGGDTAAVQTPNLDKVATLELAREEATQELGAALATLQAAQTRESQARLALLVAQSGETELAHDLALSAYVEALHAHQAACGKARRDGFPVPNIAEMVMDLYRADEARGRTAA